MCVFTEGKKEQGVESTEREEMEAASQHIAWKDMESGREN